jgi:Sulfatase-modifying factor enzyme 1
MRPPRGQCTNLDECIVAQQHEIIEGEYRGLELCCPVCKMRLTPPPINPFAFLIKLALALALLAGVCGGSFWLFYRHTSDSNSVSDHGTQIPKHETSVPNPGTPVPNHETPISNQGPFVNGQNSIGMKFVEIPDTAGRENYWSIWETRVGDFKKFIEEHPEKSPGQMFSLVGDKDQGTANYWQEKGDTWKDPGFKQTDEYPVVGVSFDDAQAFCDWLNQKEQAQLAKYHLKYRLPTDEEWRKAADYLGIYPWGNEWSDLLNPEKKPFGNYAGSEAKDTDWPRDFWTIANYHDPYPRTAPVGSFDKNRYGLFDMDGNVSEWCSTNADGNASIVICGGSWYSGKSEDLEWKHEEESPRNQRASYIGFRVIAAPR